jgi:hypothetical protein
MTAAIFLSTPVRAHTGDLDANGCHYKGKSHYHCHQDAAPNTHTDAAAKKSRQNVCHDKTSPNYNKLRRFMDFDSMEDCLKSGGTRYDH